MKVQYNIIGAESFADKLDIVDYGPFIKLNNGIAIYIIKKSNIKDYYYSKANRNGYLSLDEPIQGNKAIYINPKDAEGLEKLFNLLKEEK